MPAPRKYPQELRERAIRLVTEAMAEESELSLNAAVQRIAPRVGIVPDTLRGWVKQTRIDAGLAPGTTTSDAAGIKVEWVALCSNGEGHGSPLLNRGRKHSLIINRTTRRGERAGRRT